MLTRVKTTLTLEVEQEAGIDLMVVQDPDPSPNSMIEMEETTLDHGQGSKITETDEMTETEEMEIREIEEIKEEEMAEKEKAVENLGDKEVNLEADMETVGETKNIVMEDGRKTLQER